jgi:hypothetical protein
LKEGEILEKIENFAIADFSHPFFGVSQLR